MALSNPLNFRGLHRWASDSTNSAVSQSFEAKRTAAVDSDSGLNMKTIASTSLAFFALIGAAFAQLPDQPTIDSAKRDNGKVRDGFTLAAGQILVTRNGVTEKVTQEFVLTNGDHVYPNGDIRLHTGATKRLAGNQLLTLDGLIIDVRVTPQGVAPVIPAGADKGDVGISSRDGITISGSDTFVTRNGVTEKNSRQMHLSNGALVNPDGTVVMKDGSKITLRENQILGFDGVIHEAPIRTENSAAPAPESAGKTNR
jgi:hypothetical protein